MYPLINLKFITLPAYGLTILIGIILGVILAIKLRKLYNFEIIDILAGSIAAFTFAIFFAKLLYAVTKLPEIIENIEWVKNNIAFTINYAFSGYVYYGGFFGILLGLYLFCCLRKINIGQFINMFIPSIVLVHAFGRLGCFLGGCCYGIKYNGFLSINYPVTADNPDLAKFSRFPVQLLEMILILVIFVYLLYLAVKKANTDNRLLYIYLVLYPICRFFTEFLRGDSVRGVFFGLSTSQYISIILFLVGIYKLLV